MLKKLRQVAVEITPVNAKLAIMIADARGVKIHSNTRASLSAGGSRHYPFLVYHSSGLTGFTSSSDVVSNLQIVSFGEWVDILCSEPDEIVLEGAVQGYTVRVREGEVKVGCQTITLENFRKIQKAVGELNPVGGL